MTSNISFIWHNFDSISKEELYDVLSLRQKVFIIEQNCFYEDLDYSDQEANHLLLYKDNKLIGYSRVFPPGIKYDDASIGRIVTDEEYRGKGYGKIIAKESIQFLKNNYPKSDISISAQFRLIDFYEDFGFIKVGSVYLEDDIDHIKMRLNVNI
jgi:ElaA protein|tara:strand:+ start:727 stop:1188 length:462 start_codon:yes stop_codon:yes gene_type:complete